MKAVVFDEGLKLVNDYAKPVPEKGEALIKVTLAGICNTDYEITKGYMGYKGILGHEAVGVVVDVNGEDKSLIGKRVVSEISYGCKEPDCKYCAEPGFPASHLLLICFSKTSHRFSKTSRLLLKNFASAFLQGFWGRVVCSWHRWALCALVVGGWRTASVLGGNKTLQNTPCGLPPVALPCQTGCLGLRNSPFGNMKRAVLQRNTARFATR